MEPSERGSFSQNGQQEEIHMKKKMMAFLTALLLLVSVVPVHAAAADVTGKMSGDRDLKKISEMFAAYTTAMNLSGSVSDEQMDISLADANRLSIGAFVRYNYKDDFGFTAKELKKETRDLFGRAAKTSALKEQGQENMLVCAAGDAWTSDPYMYCGGDFSDCIPSYKIKKVVQLKKNLFSVQIQNRMRIYGEKGSEDMGTTTLKVKKDKDSAYGYIVRDVAYKK